MSGIIGASPDMKSGVVGKFPAGTVLQTFFYQPTTTGSVTSETTTGSDTTNKTMGNSSNFAVTGNVNIYHAGGGDVGCGFKIQINGTDATNAHAYSTNRWGGDVSDGHIRLPFPISGYLTSLTLAIDTTITILGTLYVAGTATTAYETHSGIIIQEIAT